MTVKRICSWFLASAITVVFAATLMTLALPTPAEAGPNRFLCAIRDGCR